jgi:predicted esterase
MQNCLKLICLLAMVAISGVCLAQAAEFTPPEQIDIYKFDPSTTLQSDGRDLAEQGYAAYNKADYELAAKFYLAYLQRNPDDAGSWYNLSCCFGLLSQAELAGKYLKIAYKKGFTDTEHIKRDTDFSTVKEDKAFANAVDSLLYWNEKKANLLGEMSYFPSKHFLPYWLHLPKNFDKTKSYTLLIGLHGYGDKASNFSYLWRHLESDNVIFVVPEAPYPFVEGKDAGFSWGPFVPMEDKIFDQSWQMLDEYITDLADFMQKEYKIKQTWLMGFSQGAFNGYLLALKNPDEFAGLIACGGGLVTEVLKDKDYRAAKKMQIIISHGRQDKVVSFEEGQKAFEVLKSKKMNVKLLPFEGAHSVSPDVLKYFLDLVQTGK